MYHYPQCLQNEYQDMSGNFTIIEKRSPMLSLPRITPPTKKRSCRTYPESGAGTVEYVIVLIVAVVIGAGLLGFDFTSVVSANKMFGNCQSLSKVSLGSNWKWVIYDDGEGTNSYLPAPSSKYISGADGKWYSISTGKGYAPQDIPNNTGDTYVASKRLLSK